MSELVLCPKCGARVSIPNEQQGRRVRCPACQKPFTTAAPLDQVGPSIPVTSSASGPIPDSPTAQDDWLGLDDVSDGSVRAKAGADQTAERADRFRIRCPTCESILYVSHDQVGKTVPCSECQSRVRVPRPVGAQSTTSPPSGVGWPATASTSGADTATASQATPHVENSGSSANELLESAEASAESAAATERRDQARLSGWSGSVAKLFTDPGAVMHLLVLAAFLSVPVGITVSDTKLGFATFPFMAIGFSLAMTCGLALIQSIANAEKNVEEWPTIDLYAWLESCLIVGSALVCSVTPSLFLATLVTAETLVTVSLMLVGAHLLFPFFILSILETQSVFAPVSLEVAQGWKRCWKECRQFYVLAGSILGLAPLYFAMVPRNPVTAGIGAAICVLITFLYAALLGRFAFVLRESDA